MITNNEYEIDVSLQRVSESLTHYALCIWAMSNGHCRKNRVTSGDEQGKECFDRLVILIYYYCGR